MATFTWPKEQMVAESSRISDEIVIPAGLTEAKMSLTMNVAEMRDPTTDVLGILEFFDDVQLNDWRLIASTRLTGSPANTKADTPYVRIDAGTLTFLIGKRVRGRLEAKSAGNYGAVLSWA